MVAACLEPGTSHDFHVLPCQAKAAKWTSLNISKCQAVSRKAKLERGAEPFPAQRMDLFSGLLLAEYQFPCGLLQGTPSDLPTNSCVSGLALDRHPGLQKAYS